MSRTFGDLTLSADGTTWCITRAEPHVVIRMKQLFPRIPKTATAVFRFPNDPAHCADLAWFTTRYPLSMASRCARRLAAGRRAYDKTQRELERILTRGFRSDSFAGLQAGMVIREYQAQAIEILKRKTGLLLGDDLGLGKTYAAAGFCLVPGVLPAAVVVQTHLQDQWAEKLSEFTTLTIHRIKGTKPYTLPSADVYIFRYSQLLGWIDTFENRYFKTVIYDEVQELRTGASSGKGEAAHKLSNFSKYRLGLSATPIYNYGFEIWNILRCIDDTVLGTQEEFRREWCEDERVKNPEALGTFLREQHIFLRRTKKDVGQHMPAVVPLVETVECDPAAMESIAVLAHRLALQTFSGTFFERGAAARELDMMARQATGVGKALSVAAYVRILLEANVPVMLMGWHRAVYEIWNTTLADFKPVMFTGSESAKQKNDAKQAFLSGKTNLLIMSLRSGAGLDGLQHHCSTVVFGELDWSPKIHEQVIGRLDREGQTEPVTAIYLNCNDGSDPPIVELLGLKASQSSGIVDPGRVFEAAKADVSRVRALAKQFLDKREIALLEQAENLLVASLDPEISLTEDPAFA